MNKTTRTTGPLHFEDLEPHRFEDLVRQLLYDFKVWKALEATGRAGSEKGFDIRAWETIYYNDIEYEEQESEEVENQYAKGEDRVWLIQCKREKFIGPKKMRKYIEGIDINSEKPLYGIIFVAACDFSKDTRDIFYEIVRKKGVQEHYIWGKGEIEDLLFQPKNDHLLFAYFGISLTIRKRSLTSNIRSKISMKRKAIKSLGDIYDSFDKRILIRDANDDKYPFWKEIKNFVEKPRWKTYIYIGHGYDGIRVITNQYCAYISDDRKKYDYFDKIDDNRIINNSWLYNSEKEKQEEENMYDLLMDFWNKIPDQNRVMLHNISIIPYSKIIEIDKDGDLHYLYPHIYIEFNEPYGPFTNTIIYDIFSLSGIYNSQDIVFEDKMERINYFPKRFSGKKSK